MPVTADTTTVALALATARSLARAVEHDRRAASATKSLADEVKVIMEIALGALKRVEAAE